MVGLPVFGRIENLPAVAQREGAQELLVAVPSATGHFVRRAVDLARDAQPRRRIIPSMFEILSGDVRINQIRDVRARLESVLVGEAGAGYFAQRPAPVRRCTPPAQCAILYKEFSSVRSEQGALQVIYLTPFRTLGFEE